MTPLLIISIVAAYFLVLLLISWITGKGAGNSAFFLGERRSPWYIVAFGMIGASLSGVTFISVPGWVADSQFTYMQMVLGYLVGYAVIANVLMPLYYRLQLTSIYTYLDERLGRSSYKTGASFFLLSRVVGASFRLYLVASVLQMTVFDQWGVPFWLTVVVTIALIWLYTNRGGIRTIIWTDTLQTVSMLAAVVITLVLITRSMDLSMGEMIGRVRESGDADIWVWKDWTRGNHFVKHFLSGAFITIVMTGLDQDMMQKNLSCRNIREAKKNMYLMSSSLVLVNLVFLFLGAVLLQYVDFSGMCLPDDSDFLFPGIATGVFTENGGVIAGAGEAVAGAGEVVAGAGEAVAGAGGTIAGAGGTVVGTPGAALPAVVGLFFIVGLVAAAYSSADSALTSLTTSFTVDILNGGRMEEARLTRTRRWVHVGVSLVLALTIMLFREIKNESVIESLFTFAGYTYGPLLGLYAFGLFTRLRVRDRWVPLLAVLSPVLSFLLSRFSGQLFGGYQIGFELLIINGALMFAGLLIISRRTSSV